MNNKNLIGGLRIAMQALAGKFGIGLTFSGRTAFTDSKRINLPVLDHVDDHDVAVLARGYVDHESAHIRFTDFAIKNDGWQNILEDIRVEREMALAYPGVSVNLKNLVRHIKKDGESFLGERARPVSVLKSWALCWGRSHILNQDLRDYEGRMKALAMEIMGPSFCAAFMEILEKLPGSRTTADCKNLALEIEDLLRQNPPPPEERKDTESEGRKQEDKSDMPEKENEEGFGGSQEDQEDRGEKEDCSSRDGNDHEDQDGQGEKQGEESRQDDRESDGEENADDSGERFDIGRILKDRLNHAVEESQAPLVPPAEIYRNNDDPVIANTFYGKMDWSQIHPRIVPEYERALHFAGQSLDEIKETRRETAQLRAGLDGLLQSLRLRGSHRVSSGHRISGNDCYLVGANTPDTRVFRTRKPAVYNNTAVAILVDSSSSMQLGDPCRCRVATCATYVITQALEAMAGIETIVGHFPAAWTNEEDMRGVHVVKDFGEKLSLETFTFPPCGGTPLRPALLWGGMQLGHRPEPRKILLVITDGEISGVPAVMETVKTVQGSGVELYGIGIETVSATQWLPPGNGVNITDVSELPKAMVGLLKQALVPQK